MYDAEIADSKYQIFRCGRDPLLSDKSRGGGVFLAISKFFKCRCVFLNVSSMEYVLVKVSVSNCYSLFICVIYFAPRTRLEDYVKFFEAFEELNLDDSPLVFLGAENNFRKADL